MHLSYCYSPAIPPTTIVDYSSGATPAPEGIACVVVRIPCPEVLTTGNQEIDRFSQTTVERKRHGTRVFCAQQLSVESDLSCLPVVQNLGPGYGPRHRQSPQGRCSPGRADDNCSNTVAITEVCGAGCVKTSTSDSLPSCRCKSSTCP